MKAAGSVIEKYQPLWGSWKVDKLLSRWNGCEVYGAHKEEWGKSYISNVKYMSISIDSSDIKEARAIGLDTASIPDYFKNLVGSMLNEIELMYKLRGNSNIVIYEDHAVYEKKGALGWDVLIRMEPLLPLPDYLVDKELGRLGVAKLGIDICKALEACAKEGIIHRDIRDSSIFVSPRGEFKLGNFSMAKELLKGWRTAQASFNPLYMAPELYKEQSYDYSIDAYSLGLVMYKLLNKGRLPFLPLPPNSITVEDTEIALAARMAGNELAKPVNSGENLGAIILKACSYDKKDRYKSPQEFRQKLERLVKSEEKAVKNDNATADGAILYSAHSCEAAAALSDDLQAEAGKAYEEQLEKEAVAEVASSAEAASNMYGLTGKKPAITLAIGAGILILAFALAAAANYDAGTGSEETAIQPVPEIVLVTPHPTVKAADPTATPVITQRPSEEKSAEEYYRSGLNYMKSKKFTNALWSFEKAKGLGYERKKAEAQIKAAQNQIEIQKLYKKAIDYYDRQDYESAISTFTELAIADASYGSSAEYAGSFLQLAAQHNFAGVRHHNEGRVEEAMLEFEKALVRLEDLRENTSNYDQQNYSKLKLTYEGNKNKAMEKADKIGVCFKLASECNAAGVELYNEGAFSGAKTEFENALNYLKEIRLLVPKYSSKGYDGLLQIYEGNLSRAENSMK